MRESVQSCSRKKCFVFCREVFQVLFYHHVQLPLLSTYCPPLAITGFRLLSERIVLTFDCQHSVKMYPIKNLQFFTIFNIFSKRVTKSYKSSTVVSCTWKGKKAWFPPKDVFGNIFGLMRRIVIIFLSTQRMKFIGALRYLNVVVKLENIF